MKREEYIDKLVAFARLKWHIDKATESEMRLVLEMMPDRNEGCGNNCPFQPQQGNPEKNIPKKTRPYDTDIVLMYGCPIPDPINTVPWNGKDYSGYFKIDPNKTDITTIVDDLKDFNQSITTHTGKLGEDLFYTNDKSEEK